MKIIISKGFGLIEILVAVFIVAFGVLAIGNLQVNLITASNDNLARQEATQIAQNRIDELRNYFNQFDDSTPAALLDDESFEQNFAGKTDPYVNGENASFTISESISEDGNGNAIIVVSVAWDNTLAEPEAVSLSTELSFLPSLSLLADGGVGTDPFIDPPTGRAFLGQGNIDLSKTPTTTITDSFTGVTAYEYEGDENKYLAIDGSGDDTVGDKIVLTLEEACVLGTGEEFECTDFVEISGRVFISDDFIRASSTGNSTYNASDIFVLASDAAYCSRYTGKESNTVFEKSVTPIEFDDLLDDDAGRYFYYKCFIGGGWHGNIGLVFDPTSQSKACVGYGSSAIESRSRTYRGIAIESDDPTQPPLSTDYDDVSKMRSWGIADATLITTNDEKHDFWLTHDSSASACTNTGGFSILEGNKRDFYCLNEIKNFAKGIILPYIASPDDSVSPSLIENSEPRSHLDERLVDSDRDGKYDKVQYHFDSICKIDPTNPPLFLYQFDSKVSVTFNSADNIESKLSNLSNLEVAFNSDSEAQCYYKELEIVSSVLFENYTDAINFKPPLVRSGEDYSFAENSNVREAYFSCFLYDYGTIDNSTKELVANGWSGEIYVQENASAKIFSCPTNMNGSALLSLSDIKDSSDLPTEVVLECTE